jgi:hypothetical protein
MTAIEKCTGINGYVKIGSVIIKKMNENIPKLQFKVSKNVGILRTVHNSRIYMY